MTTEEFLIYTAVMAGVTYLIRAVPFTLCRNKFQNKFIRSFLYYIPYSVLAAMTFPAILYSTSSVLVSAAGMLIAIAMAYRGKSLLTVAVSGCITVLVINLIQMFTGSGMFLP